MRMVAIYPDNAANSELESLKTRPFFKFGSSELDEWHADHRKDDVDRMVAQAVWDSRYGQYMRYVPYARYGAYIVDHGDSCTFNEVFAGQVAVAMTELPKEIALALRRHHCLDH